MVLQPANADDHAAIVALANHAYRGTGAVTGWTNEAYIVGDRITLDLLRADLAAAPDAHLLVHRDRTGTPRGSVWLQPKAGDIWQLGLFAVDPALQQTGIGRAVLAAAETFARGHGAHTIEMSVINIRDTLIAWYERRGYARTGATTFFPYGDERFGRPTRDDLCFVTLAKQV